MNQKKLIKKIEVVLNKLGKVEDNTELLEGTEKMSKFYSLHQNKYEDVTDDSVDIFLYRNSVIEISNDQLPYTAMSEEESEYLYGLFMDSNFIVNINEIPIREQYRSSVTVGIKTRRIEDLKDLIGEYRMLNTQYLKKYGVTTYYEKKLPDGSIKIDYKRVTNKE